MNPEKKARQRLNRRLGREDRKRAAELAAFIRQEAAARSQVLRRSDVTVWQAYNNLRTEAKRCEN